MNVIVVHIIIHADLMPSIEDVMVLLLVPVLEYLIYPHLRRSMGLKIKLIHKVIATIFFS